ncbi:MAG: MFS transporter [Solirubrobacteraceae bacterium]
MDSSVRTRSLPGWAPMVAACVGMFMVVLDTTIVNVALPSIRHGLRMSIADLQWVINAYLLTLGGLLLLGGRIGDHFGRRRVYLIGIAIFSLTSLVGGLAPNGAILVAARAAQGVGAALLTPATLSLLTSTYTEPRERTRALAIWSATGASGGATGVVLGGVLTQLLSWRWTLFVNVPLGAAVLVLGRLALGEFRRPQLGERLDVGGALSITLSMTALVYGMIESDSSGWGSADTLAPLAAAVALLLAFVAIERRVSTPLIPLGILRRRSIATGSTVTFALGTILTSVFYFLSLYLQDVRHHSALAAGALFAPMMLTNVAASRVSMRLVRKLEARFVLAGGMAAMTAGLVWLSQWGVHGSLLLETILPSMVVGAGVGVAWVPITVIGTTGMDHGDAGLASGIINAGRQVGGSVGLAVFSVIALAHAHSLLAGGSGTLKATVSGYSLALLTGAAVSLAGAVLALGAGRTSPASAAAEEAAEAVFESV